MGPAQPTLLASGEDASVLGGLGGVHLAAPAGARHRDRQTDTQMCTRVLACDVSMQTCGHSDA